MIEPVRYGVAGLGRAGWDIHIDQLRGRADARIVAVADGLADRRAQAVSEFGCRAYATFDEMLQQDDVEVVIVATPSVDHAPQALRAMEAGRHVVVEKPLGMNVAEVDGMIRTAQRTGRLLFPHQNYRFMPIATHLVEVVRSGLLGRLFHIRASVSTFVRRNDWQTLVRHGGGVLNNTAPHYLDMVLQLMGGKPVQVMGDLQRIASVGDAEDHMKAFIRTDNGVTADVEISNVQNVAVPLPRWILCGTQGTLTCDIKTSTLRWFDPADLKPLQVDEQAVPNRSYDNGDIIPWQEKTMPAAGSDKQTFYDNVAAVLRNDVPMRVTPESVREVMRLIEQIRVGTKYAGLAGDR